MSILINYFVHFYIRMHYGDADLIIEKCSRTDAMFYKNQGSKILLALSESLELANTTAETIDVNKHRP